MAKITVGDVVMEGTIEELREWAELSGFEFPAVKAEASTFESLKVGDYAKVVKWPLENIGVIVEITNLDHDAATLNPINSDFPTYSCVDYLIKATDEEVAEAKKERLVNERKWAKIGRKPNEFKKGDLVYGERSNNIGEFIYGKVCEVTDGRDRCLAVKSSLDGKYRAVFKSTLELITPVEARFDIDGE